MNDPYDCHGGPGTTEPACGACITCLHRVIGDKDARIVALQHALGLAVLMHNDWLEMQEDGYAGAYYAFVKGNDDEWDVIMKAFKDS